MSSLCEESTGAEEIAHDPNITLKLLLKHGENLTRAKSSGRLNAQCFNWR